jgi:hypothetical protein
MLRLAAIAARGCSISRRSTTSDRTIARGGLGLLPAPQRVAQPLGGVLVHLRAAKPSAALRRPSAAGRRLTRSCASAGGL